jgi:hypothetical protein
MAENAWDIRELWNQWQATNLAKNFSSAG